MSYTRSLNNNIDSLNRHCRNQAQTIVDQRKLLLKWTEAWISGSKHWPYSETCAYLENEDGPIKSQIISLQEVTQKFIDDEAKRKAEEDAPPSKSDLKEFVHDGDDLLFGDEAIRFLRVEKETLRQRVEELKAECERIRQIKLSFKIESELL